MYVLTIASAMKRMAVNELKKRSYYSMKCFKNDSLLLEI